MSDSQPPIPIPESIRDVVRQLWRRLLTGILVAIPLVVTLSVLNIAYRFITGISTPFWKALGVENFPLLGFFTTIGLLIFVGFMATHVLGKRIIETTEEFILRVPLISPLYSAVKQALESFRTMKQAGQFKRVVYVEYPSEGCFLLGFVTNQFCEPSTGQDFTLVFVPTSPNPLTGFVIAIPCERVRESALSLEQATKLIVSAGLVVPPPIAPQSGAVVLANSSEFQTKV